MLVDSWSAFSSPDTPSDIDTKGANHQSDENAAKSGSKSALKSEKFAENLFKEFIKVEYGEDANCNFHAYTAEELDDCLAKFWPYGKIYSIFVAYLKLF